MKFYPLKTEAPEGADLSGEYREAREIGVIRLGRERLFFRKLRRAYYIAYPEISRCFRRVMLVPTKCCCGRGELQIENLVVCDGERELAVIQLPGARAAEAVMQELTARTPHAKHTKD